MARRQTSDMSKEIAEKMVTQPNGWHERILKYDYLVIALGSENNFFKMYDVQKYSFTMKSIDDAIILRNHIMYCDWRH